MDICGYAIRIDALDGYKDRIQWLSAVVDYESIIGVEHRGTKKENPHYHLVIRTRVQEQTIRKRFKKMFDKGKGNGHMSIKTWDGALEAISYLFHEDSEAELVIRHNVADELIERARQLNNRVQEEVQKSKDRASIRLEQVVYDMLQPKGECPDARTVAKLILSTALRTDRYLPSVFQIRSMVTKIRFKLLNGDVDAEDQFLENLVDEAFPNN